MLVSLLMSLPLATAQTSMTHYTIIDRGPTLVRTLINTPGLNAHGDLAVWHATQPSLMEGEVFHDREDLHIVSQKEYSLVYPADLNDRLMVVGSLQSPQDIRFTRAFLWSQNQLQMLPSIGGPYSAADAINASGDVVGSAETSDHARHAVLWLADRASAPRDLGLLAQGDFSAARDINSHSSIVGEANIKPLGKPQAFFWRNGHMAKLQNLPGGTFCSAQALNDKDDVIGYCDLPNGTSHGVLWKSGHIHDLGTLGDDDSPSTALDINAHDQVVGTSEISDSKLRAFLWQGGKMLNLNEAIPPRSGWLLLVASRINDHGEIAGRGFYHGAVHTFLLQPDPASPAQVR